MHQAFSIRRMSPGDLPQVAHLASALLRQHHAADPRRFFMPEAPESGYAQWFSQELENSQALLLVAAQHSEAFPARKEADLDSVDEVDRNNHSGASILGYCYGRLEPRDWNLLLDEHGAIHDLFVKQSARRLGVGSELLRTMVEELTSLGAARIVLSTMVGNVGAQKLFAKHGFRATLLEMTRG